MGVAVGHVQMTEDQVLGNIMLGMYLKLIHHVYDAHYFTDSYQLPRIPP